MPKKKQNLIKRSPFSERLRYLRKQKGINMEQLAQIVEVSKSYISLLESGERQPSRDVVLKLAQALFPQGNGHGRDELLIMAGFAPEQRDNLALYRNLIEIYEQNLHHNPQDFRTYTLLILSLIKAHRYEEAQEKIQKGFQFFSEAVQLQCLLSNLELSRGNFDGAILNQQTAIENYKLQRVTTKLNISLADLYFNLGEIFFLKGYADLGDYLTGGSHDATLKQAAIQNFEKASQEFEQAMQFAPEDAYIQDEFARVHFNLAFLEQGQAALAHWEKTITHFRKVLTAPEKHSLGQANLMESSAFLAHAYSKSGQFGSAELTLGLLSNFHPDYWLVHYIQACYYNLKFEATGDKAYLEQALQSLQTAIRIKDPQNQTRHEAKVDPDLKALREFKTHAFNKLISEGAGE